MQSYRGTLKIDREIQHLEEPMRSNMQMMVDAEVSKLVNKNMS
tara:strand:+ start:278 stop:406 length:129 start_codon:yes stop_codon:yes gene_type:complete